MGQNKNNSLWLKITELMSKISTLLGKRIEKWTQKINNEIIKEENSGKGLTSATVVNMSESNMANQSEQDDSSCPTNLGLPFCRTLIFHKHFGVFGDFTQKDFGIFGYFAQKDFGKFCFHGLITVISELKWATLVAVELLLFCGVMCGVMRPVNGW